MVRSVEIVRDLSLDPVQRAEARALQFEAPPPLHQRSIPMRILTFISRAASVVSLLAVVAGLAVFARAPNDEQPPTVNAPPEKKAPGAPVSVR
jgi:hypothetical protein